MSNLPPLSDKQLKRSLYIAAICALLLPPFVGGSLMGLVGFYPMPEFYLIFTSYPALYVLAVTSAVLLWLPRLYKQLIAIPEMEGATIKKNAQQTSRRYFVLFIAGVAIYSNFGILSADLSLERMGLVSHTAPDHIYHQLGIIPVVLITTFPIFFYIVDRLGRYLAPRGVCITAIPLSLKLAMLGTVTPLLIDTLLIGYYYNRTGYFSLETLLLWFSLFLLAVIGTVFAMRSFHQGITPLADYIDSHAEFEGAVKEEFPSALSLDEMGVLTSRFANLLAKQSILAQELQNASNLADTFIDSAGVLVLVLNHEGHIIRFNQACEQLSGYRAEEVLGKFPWETVLSPEDANTIRDEAFKALAENPQQMSGSYTNYWLSSSGERRLLEWSNTLILNEDGSMKYMVSVGVDITEKSEAEESLRQSREQLSEAQRLAMVGSWSLNLVSNELLWSDEIYRIFELDKGRFEPSYDAFLGVIHPEDRDAVNQAYSDSLVTKEPYQITHRLLLPDGQIKYVQESCETLFDDEGNPLLSHGTVQDITEQKRAEEIINLYANVFRHSAEAIMITDHENRIIAINPALTELTGYTLDELQGSNPSILASGHTPHNTYEQMWQALNESGHWQGELTDRRKNGEIYPKWATITVVHDEQGNVLNHIASFSDITERKASEERIFRLAHHDTLTGLFNRFSLEERLGQAVASAKRSGDDLAVMFIDMDRFKLINDTLGHHVGDGLLVEVAKRLTASVRESDIVARLGGDEFIVVLTGIDDQSLVRTIAEKVLHSLSSPYVILEHELHSSPSIGIALFPEDGDDSDTLMKNADTAMYDTKKQGRNNYQFFNHRMTEAVNEGMAIERDLRLALERDEFTLYYQPKVEGTDGRISGVEALIRWNHPERGMVPPDLFIPLAEEHNLIKPIGQWVLNQACAQLSQWRQQGISLKMAVNLSPKQLSDPGLVTELRQLMEKYHIARNKLELEITETAAMTDAEHAARVMQDIRSTGVELAIDDFGTGYSSLAYLKIFPIQTLKLDRTFVRDIGEDENDTAICIATISLAHSLGLRVVAEGVETELQKHFLTSHHCDTLQGYFFSAPVPADELASLVQAGAGRQT